MHYAAARLLKLVIQSKGLFLYFVDFLSYILVLLHYYKEPENRRNVSIHVDALLRAFSISTMYRNRNFVVEYGVNALLRAFSISTVDKDIIAGSYFLCQCPASGFLHFYSTPPEPLCLCGFPAPFLQVIHRIF